MIEAPQVAAAIRRVVDRVGDDHVDRQPHCYTRFYVNDLGCLIGEVLKDLNAYLPDHDHRLNFRKVPTLVLEAMIPVTLEALDLLIAAQKLNDDLVPWGEIRDELTDDQEAIAAAVKP